MPSAAKTVIRMKSPTDMTRGVIFSDIESGGGFLSAHIHSRQSANNNFKTRLAIAMVDEQASKCTYNGTVFRALHIMNE